MEYKKYIGSTRWRRRRRRYFKKFGKFCAACGSVTDVTLHHMTYETLGTERDDDLLALCVDHHKLLHKLYPRTCRENTLLFLVEYQDRETVRHMRSIWLDTDSRITASDSIAIGSNNADRVHAL